MSEPHTIVRVSVGDFLSPIQFPSTTIAPTLDLTERAIQDVGSIAQDFERALIATDNVSRSFQLRERVTACIQLLAVVERAAFDQVDALSEAKGNS